MPIPASDASSIQIDHVCPSMVIFYILTDDSHVSKYAMVSIINNTVQKTCLKSKTK